MIGARAQVDKKGLRDKKYYESLKMASEEVIIVKLADRLNNITRLESSPEEGKKERYIHETIEHYLPLAKKHSQYFFERITEELVHQRT
jgi:(p)ppGpp synthase/HD superfamily hydrolase